MDAIKSQLLRWYWWLGGLIVDLSVYEVGDISDLLNSAVYHCGESDDICVTNEPPESGSRVLFGGLALNDEESATT